MNYFKYITFYKMFYKYLFYFIKFNELNTIFNLFPKLLLLLIIEFYLII